MCLPHSRGVGKRALGSADGHAGLSGNNSWLTRIIEPARVSSMILHTILRKIDIYFHFSVTKVSSFFLPHFIIMWCLLHYNWQKRKKEFQSSSIHFSVIYLPTKRFWKSCFFFLPSFSTAPQGAERSKISNLLLPDLNGGLRRMVVGFSESSLLSPGKIYYYNWCVIFLFNNPSEQNSCGCGYWTFWLFALKNSQEKRREKQALIYNFGIKAIFFLRPPTIRRNSSSPACSFNCSAVFVWKRLRDSKIKSYWDIFI